MNEVIQSVLPIVSGITIAVVPSVMNRWTKKTPEAINPSQIQSDIIDDLKDMIKTEREERQLQAAEQNKKINDLQNKVDRFWSWVLTLKGRVSTLESILNTNNIPVPPRSDAEREIFEGPSN